MTKVVNKFVAEFSNYTGKSTTISIINPKEGLTEVEMEAFGTAIIDSSIILAGGSPVTTCTTLKVVETTEEIVDEINV